MTASGDLPLSVFGREGLPASADLLSRRLKEAEDAAASGKHVLAGKEPGCLFFFTFHSSVVLVNHDGRSRCWTSALHFWARQRC